MTRTKRSTVYQIRRRIVELLYLEDFGVVEAEEDPHSGVVERVEVGHSVAVAVAVCDAFADDERRGGSRGAAQGRHGGVDVSGREGQG